MNIILPLAVAVALLTTTTTFAEERTCFDVLNTARAETASSVGMGSILLNKCTGDSWLLLPRKQEDGGTAMRWTPIKRVDTEATISSTIPTERRK